MLTSDDLYLSIFVLIDDILKENPEINKRPGPKPIISDSEMLTLLILQCLSNEISDEAWLRHVRRHYQNFFPNVPERTRYQRRRGVLQASLEVIVSWIHSALGESQITRIIDSAPLPVCRNVRAKRCKNFKGQASVGYCAAQKTYYYGFKLHLMVTESGLPASWIVMPAKHHDTKGLKALTKNKQSLDIYGDAAYLIKIEDREKYEKKNISVTSAVRKNMEPLPLHKERKLRKLRFRVDWAIGLLSRSLSVQKTLSRKLKTLSQRMSFMMCAFNVAIILNDVLCRPHFQIKSLAA